MVYLDTNIIIAANAKNFDSDAQKEIASKLFLEAIKSKTLLVSELLLYETAFVCGKIKEDEEITKRLLSNLSSYLKSSSSKIANRAIELSILSGNIKSINDAHHLSFAEHKKCKKLYTFDKGFKRFNEFSSIDIEVL